jgi:hypothetical protein
MSPIPNIYNTVAARSKAWVCGRSLAGVAGSFAAGGLGVCRECCVLSGRVCDGPITDPESPTECGVSECDREPSILRRSWSTAGCCARGVGYIFSL